MKKILNILIPLFTLLLILAPLCRADSVVMVGFGAAVAGDPTPDYQWNLDDNTNSTAVSATHGANATIYGDTYTSDVHSGTAYEGTGSFAFQADGYVAKGLLAAIFEDEVFTVEFTIKGDTSGTSAYARFLIDTNGKLRINRYNSDTVIRVTTPLYTADFTVADMDDNQWHVFRFVFDSGESTDKIRCYQKTADESWVSRGASANLGALDGFSSFSMYGDGSVGWGNASRTYLADVVKVWDSVVVPE